MMMLIMVICGFPALWITVGLFAFSAKVKKGCAMGLKIPEGEENNEDMAMILRRCRRMLLGCGVILSLLVVPLFCVPYESVVFAVWMTWLMLAVFIPILFFGHYFNCMKKLKQAKNWDVGREEERHWYGGILYYNKENPKVLVMQPVGGGNSFNLARFPGKIIMGLVILCIVTLPLWGLWIMAEDFTEAEVAVWESAVGVNHLETEYVLAFDDVTQVALLREMPPCRREAGYELTYLTKGIFTVEGYGESRLCVDRRDGAILALRTAQGAYFISFDTEAEALKVINGIDME